jgi:hypothetical protein
MWSRNDLRALLQYSPPVNFPPPPLPAASLPAAASLAISIDLWLPCSLETATTPLARADGFHSVPSFSLDCQDTSAGTLGHMATNRAG